MHPDTARKRVTGGRWRRTVLGHVLAEHVVVVEVVVRVSGRRGSGSLPAAAPLGAGVKQEGTSQKIARETQQPYLISYQRARHS